MNIGLANKETLDPKTPKKAKNSTEILGTKITETEDCAHKINKSSNQHTFAYETILALVPEASENVFNSFRRSFKEEKTKKFEFDTSSTKVGESNQISTSKSENSSMSVKGRSGSSSKDVQEKPAQKYQKNEIERQQYRKHRESKRVWDCSQDSLGLKKAIKRSREVE